MKKLLSTLVLMALSSLALAAPPKQATYEVKNMTCGTCALAIERALKRAGGVSKIDFDGKAATVIVQFDPAQTSAASIQKTITEAGFPAKLRVERG
jgi:mercuric transport protein